MAWPKTKIVCAGVLLAVLTIYVASEIQAHRVYPGVAGIWVGTNSAQRFALEIARTNGAYAAHVTYIDSGVRIPAVNLTVRQHSVRFRYAVTKEFFAARIDRTMTRMTGRWDGDKTELTFTRTDKTVVSEPLSESDYAPRPGADLQGAWTGIMQDGAKAVNIALRFAEPPAGPLRAEMDRMDWGGHQIPATHVSRNGDAVTVVFRVFGEFNARFDRSAGQLSGTWMQFGQTNPASFIRADGQAEPPAEAFVVDNPSDLQGHWRGMVQMPGVGLHLAFHIAKLPDGSVSATLDEPEMGQNKIPCSTVEYTRPHVSIMWQGVGGVFNGRLEDGKLRGTWRQYGKVHPLTLSRSGGVHR